MPAKSVDCKTYSATKKHEAEECVCRGWPGKSGLVCNQLSGICQGIGARAGPKAKLSADGFITVNSNCENHYRDVLVNGFFRANSKRKMTQVAEKGK